MLLLGDCAAQSQFQQTSGPSRTQASDMFHNQPFVRISTVQREEREQNKFSLE